MNILEIEISTDDIHKTDRFYSGTLGFQLIYKTADRLSYIAGTSTLTFRKSFNAKPTHHFAFTIPSNKLEECIQWTISKLELMKVDGQDVVAEFKSWNAKAIYFYDNNGNILEFIARYHLDNKSVEPFDISSIRCISEIGIVTDNVDVLVNQLASEENLSVYSRWERGNDFAPVGDEDGLFIVVKSNRNWFPAKEQPAQKHPVWVKISVDGIIKELIFNKPD